MKKAPLWCVHRTQSGNFDDMVIVCDDLTSVVGMGWGEWGITHTHTRRTQWVWLWLWWWWWMLCEWWWCDVVMMLLMQVITGKCCYFQNICISICILLKFSLDNSPDCLQLYVCTPSPPPDHCDRTHLTSTRLWSKGYKM